MAHDQKDLSGHDQVTASFIAIAIRLGVLALLLYWSLVLVLPFISIVIWSVVLTVTLYPVFEWMSFRLGGHRRLAAALITILSLLIIIGPATWLALGLVDSLRMISERLDFSTLTIVTLAAGPAGAAHRTARKSSLLLRCKLHFRNGSFSTFRAYASDFRCSPNSWGNRPASLWIAEDFGCCASG